MLYIVVALHCEAKPLIREFELKRDNSARFFEIYKRNDKMMVISGIGKMKSAIATAHILSMVEPENNTAVVNIGTCGSVIDKLSIGTPVLVNKIRDAETGKEYYPDMVLPHISIEQGSLETHNRIITHEDMRQMHNKNGAYSEYIDMEASGFFQAAERFVGPHQIYVVKVISDFLEGDLPDKDHVMACMEMALPEIKALIDQIADFCRQGAQNKIFTPEDEEILKGLIQHLRLTNYQSHQLYDMARAYKIRTGLKVPEFKEFTDANIKTKEEGKILFKRLSKILTMVEE